MGDRTRFAHILFLFGGIAFAVAGNVLGNRVSDILSVRILDASPVLLLLVVLGEIGIVTSLTRVQSGIDRWTTGLRQISRRRAAVILVVLGELLAAAGGLLSNEVALRLPQLPQTLVLSLFLVITLLTIGLTVFTEIRANAPRTEKTNRHQFLQNLAKEYRLQLQYARLGNESIPLELQVKTASAPITELSLSPDTAKDSPQVTTTTISVTSAHRMSDVFVDAGSALVLLGEPGAGKSTLLTQLGIELLPSARADIHRPMPVVFNLSTWSLNHLPLLGDWLIEDLVETQGVPREDARRWVEQNEILPLLDRLDEVDPEPMRNECVKAINTFHEQHPHLPIAVCCRTAEYAALSKPLAFVAEARVQPLSAGQIETVLSQNKERRTALRAAISANPDLRALLHTPLFLHMAVLTYEDWQEEHLPRESPPAEGDRDAWVRILFQDYVTQMISRRREADWSVRISADEVEYYLSWLAYQLKMNGLSDTFKLELMQPGWLPDRVARVRYREATRRMRNWIGLVAGALLGILEPALFIALIWLGRVHPLPPDAGIPLALLALAITLTVGAGVGAVIGSLSHELGPPVEVTELVARVQHQPLIEGLVEAAVFLCSKLPYKQMRDLVGPIVRRFTNVAPNEMLEELRDYISGAVSDDFSTRLWAGFGRLREDVPMKRGWSWPRALRRGVIGALIGSVIIVPEMSLFFVTLDAWVGSLLGSLLDSLRGTSGMADAGLQIGLVFGGAAGLVFGALLGALIGALIGMFGDALFTGFYLGVYGIRAAHLAELGEDDDLVDDVPQSSTLASAREKILRELYDTSLGKPEAELREMDDVDLVILVMDKLSIQRGFQLIDEILSNWQGALSRELTKIESGKRWFWPPTWWRGRYRKAKLRSAYGLAGWMAGPLDNVLAGMPFGPLLGFVIGSLLGSLLGMEVVVPLAGWVTASSGLGSEIVGICVGVLLGGLPGAVTGQGVGTLLGWLFSSEGGKIEPVVRISWSWSRALLRGLVGVLIGASLSLAELLIHFKDATWGLAFETSVALVALAALFAALFAVSGSLERGQIRDRDYRTPDEAIRRSVRSSILAFLVTIAAAGAFGLLASEVLAAVFQVQAQWLVIGLTGTALTVFSFGLPVGLLRAWSYGGGAVAQHLALRWALRRAGVIPPHFIQFLNYATAHTLLRRVGGGYQFIHVLARDYFAERYAPQAKSN